MYQGITTGLITEQLSSQYTDAEVEAALVHRLTRGRSRAIALDAIASAANICTPGGELDQMLRQHLEETASIPSNVLATIAHMAREGSATREWAKAALAKQARS